jgi:hypothetical protein
MAEAVWFFGIFSYDDAKKFNEEMVRDWQEKGMKEVQLVGPGRVLRKYVYFKTSKSQTAGGKLRVSMESETSRQRASTELGFR